MDLHDEGFIWISNLVDVGSAEVANPLRTSKIQLPLTNQWFDIVCHFLKGSLPGVLKKDPMARLSMEMTLDESTIDALMAMEDVHNDNFMAIFFAISMSVIMANYDTVSIVLFVYFCRWSRDIPVEGIQYNAL